MKIKFEYKVFFKLSQILKKYKNHYCPIKIEINRITS